MPLALQRSRNERDNRKRRLFRAFVRAELPRHRLGRLQTDSRQGCGTAQSAGLPPIGRTMTAASPAGRRKRNEYGVFLQDFVADKFLVDDVTRVDTNNVSWPTWPETVVAVDGSYFVTGSGRTRYPGTGTLVSFGAIRSEV